MAAAKNNAAKATSGGNAPRGPAASIAAAKNTAKAQQSPAFKADMGRYSIGDGYKAPTGGQIKGAIAAVKSGMTPTGYAQQNLRGPLGPNAEMRKGITASTDAYRLGQVSQNLYNKFGNRSIQDAAGFMRDYARSLPAEAAVNMTRNFTGQAQRMRDLGRVGINQALNVSTDKVMRGIDTFSKERFQKPSDISMGLVSEDSPWASRARDALSDAMTRPQTVSEVARKATNFTAPNTSLKKIHRDIKEIGRTPAGRFGVDPAYEKRTTAALAEANRRLAGEPATPTPAVNRVGTPVAGLPAPVPRPRPENQNMQRPTGPYAIAGNTAQPAAAALKRTEKLYNDRVPAETSRPMTTQQVERQYASMTDPTALPVRDVSRPMTTDQVVRQYARMGDPTQRPAPYAGPKLATKQIQDRVNVLPSNEQSLYTGRPTTVPKNQQSLYTGRPITAPKPDQSLYTGPKARRTAEQPPFAGAERILSVQDEPAAGVGMSFNGLNVPAAGMSFNPSLTRMMSPVSNEQSLYNGRMTGGMSFTGVPGTTVPASQPAGVASIPQGERAGGVFDTPVTTPQEGADVLSDAMKNAERTEDGYKLDLGKIPNEQLARQLPGILKNPDSIFDVAQEGGFLGSWNKAKDKETLTKVRDGLNDLKKMGAKVNADGTVTIPAAAAEKAQKVFNDLAKAYSKYGADKNKNPAYNDKFSGGLGSLATPISEKVNATPQAVSADAKNYLAQAQAEGMMTRPVPSANAFMPNITRQEQAAPSTLTGQGPWSMGSTTVTPRTLAPQTALPQTKQIYDRVPQEYKNVSPADALSRPYDVRLGEMKVQIGSKLSTIDNLVADQKGLTKAQRADLRRSLIGDAAEGNVEFTKEDVNKKVAEAKASYPKTSILKNPLTTNLRRYSGDLQERIMDNRSTPVLDSEAADPAFANSLIGDEAYDAAKKTGYFPGDILYNDRFLNDPTQQGILRGPAGELDATDMAKLVNRSRALRYDDVKPYLTPEEKVRKSWSGIIKGVFNVNPLSRIGKATAEKLMGIESPEAFLSRPAYEQRALYQYAKAAAAKREGRPVPEAGFPQGAPDDGVGFPSGNISSPAGGGIGDLGGGGNNGGQDRYSGSTGVAPPASTDGTSSPSTQSGPRPQIYFEWDLGVNIPSPGDPLYTMYMTYLAEREAAAAAMYG
jgi:hypothetical protein